jgi:transcriptional regulator with XRE-family HTH domain
MLRQSRTKLSQEALSAKIGVHRTFISRVERGETNITLGNIIRICGVLGVSLSEFFEEFEATLQATGEILQSSGKM